MTNYERICAASKKMTTGEPTTGEIVRALRDAPNYTGMAGTTTTVEDVAADRLESQEQTIAALTARAEQAEKERDAAIGHVHDAIFGTNHSCFYCTMENCQGCTNSTVKDHFKYRGLRPNKYLVGKDGGAE